MPVGTADINWGAIGGTLLAVTLGSFVALWAQGAPVNRGMRSALYVTIGFVGSLLFLVGLMAFVAPFISPWGPIGAGLAISLPLWRPFRQAVARLTPIDPASATHAVALITVILALLLGLVTLLTAANGQLRPPQPVSALEVIVQHLMLAPLAFFAVGFGLRRTWPVALARLGLSPLSVLPAGLSLLAGLAAGFGLLAVRAALPTLMAQPDRSSGLLLAYAANRPLAILVGISIAVGMELLFRGALQPRLGLPLTALTFTAVNVAAAAPLPLLVVLLLGVLLGLLRRRVNTTACIIAHAASMLVLVVGAAPGLA